MRNCHSDRPVISKGVKFLFERAIQDKQLSGEWKFTVAEIIYVHDNSIMSVQGMRSNAKSDPKPLHFYTVACLAYMYFPLEGPREGG